MIFWILLFGGLAIGALVDWRSEAGLVRAEGMAIGGIVGLLTALMVCTIIASADDQHHITEHTVERKLIGLQDEMSERSEAGGAFVLVAGGFSAKSDTRLTYNWYQQDADGAITAKSGVHEDGNTDIELHYLKPGERPYVLYKTISVDDYTSKTVAPFNLNLQDHDRCCERIAEESEAGELWELHVPRGAIATEIGVDLK